MTPREAERLTPYLKLVMPKKYPERVRDVAARAAASGGLETLGGTADLVQQAQAGTETLLRGGDVRPEQPPGLEAIIPCPTFGRRSTSSGREAPPITHSLWTHLSSDAAHPTERLEDAIPSIGQDRATGATGKYPYGGTGFMVGDGLVMTNRHVAGIFATGSGDRNLRFMSGEAAIDFLRELRPDGPDAEVRRMVMIHPYWDMAILRSTAFGRATPCGCRSRTSRDLVRARYSRPRLSGLRPAQPDAASRISLRRPIRGQAAAARRAAGPGRRPQLRQAGSAAAHDCSTLGGNSGSPSSTSRPARSSRCTSAAATASATSRCRRSELARDGRVVDAGVTFAGRPAGGTPPWGDWWELDEAPSAEMAAAPAAPCAAAGGTPAAVPQPARRERRRPGHA